MHVGVACDIADFCLISGALAKAGSGDARELLFPSESVVWSHGAWVEGVLKPLGSSGGEISTHL